MSRYNVGELVFAFSCQMMHLSKVLRVQQSGTSFVYLVHYLGWGQEWNEWVAEDTCLGNDAEGQRKAKVVNALAKGTSVKGKGDEGGGGALEGGIDADNLRKLNAQEKTSREVLPVAPGRVKVEVPAELRAALLEDYDLVVKRKERFLLALPCPPELTVAGLVARYVAWFAGGEAPSLLPLSARPTTATTSGSGSGSGSGQGVKRPRDGAVVKKSSHGHTSEEVKAVKGLLDALLNFYDRKLAVGCLYRQELIQYLAWCREPGVAVVGGLDADETMKAPPHAHSKTWPAVTLLRLASLLPEAFSTERGISPPEAEFINATLGDFFKWCAKYKAALFPFDQYRRVSPRYCEEFSKALHKRQQLPQLSLKECYLEEEEVAAAAIGAT